MVVREVAVLLTRTVVLFGAEVANVFKLVGGTPPVLRRVEKGAVFDIFAVHFFALINLESPEVKLLDWFLMLFLSQGYALPVAESKCLDVVVLKLGRTF